jgi:colanic acid/amylovoran biosynthesis protein
MTMHRILIAQNYNPNKGDASVVHAMKQSLLDASPGLDICLTSYDPQQAERDYELPAAETLISLRRMKLAPSRIAFLGHAIREACWVLYSILVLLAARCRCRIWIPSSRRSTVAFYLKCDLVVLPGGHFFTNLNSFPCLASHFWALLFAVLLKKKTMVYAQTIGPFFGRLALLSRLLTRFLLKRVDLVTVREQDSLRHCRGIPHVFLTSEAVFAMQSPPDVSGLDDLRVLKRKARLLVGATIHHLYYRHFFSRSVYVDKMARIFDGIIAEHDADVLLVPMEDGVHGGGDRPLALQIQDAMAKPERFHLLAGEHDPVTTAAAIGSTDVFLGTKTHSIVYALKAGIPTVTIAYQQKSNEFMEVFGVRENAIDLCDLDVERVLSIVRTVVERRLSLRNVQMDHLRIVRQEALKNNDLLLSLLAESRAA